MNLELDKKFSFKQQFKKRCFDFLINILKLSELLRNKRINWPIINQIVRSGTSIGANIVEGGNSTSKKEFINYFQIALKSASETIYWRALFQKINIGKKKALTDLLKENIEIKKIIATIILNTKQNFRL